MEFSLIGVEPISPIYLYWQQCLLLYRITYFRQLVLISELYAAQEVSEYLLPIAMALAEDKVSEVRQESYHLVSLADKLNINPPALRLAET